MKRSSARGVLPGLRLALVITLVYLAVLVLLPLAMVPLGAAKLDGAAFWNAIGSPRALASYRLSFGAAVAAALLNTIFGVVVAWVLVRYRFPGRRIVDALVDLPFALPTAVGGLALTTLYAKTGWLGEPLSHLGNQVAFAPLGIVAALTFVGLPFVVRTVQPVLEDMDPEIEEAAATLGAGRWLTFRRVLLPGIGPALATGFALAFARALGEYGSVVFIAGNMPMKTEITPLLIMTKLEQFDYAGATALATVLMVLSFTLLLIINRLQARMGPGREAL
ncbi:MAG: sulfate ABC transporter permease subunit CysT [Polyangiaceae bacterium]|nr:sulfate ABC transporter permease subunit CysT [Polyangiaceae bacterium]